MTRFKRRLSLRSAFALALGSLVTATAGAASLHRFAVTQTGGGGSGGSTAFLQTSSSGGAVQGQVGSSNLTSLSYPFGVFGLYNSSQVGFGVVGLSTTSYGVAAQSTSTYASLFGLAGGNGPAISGLSSASYNQEALYAEAQGGGDGADIYADGAGTGVTVQSQSGTGLSAMSYNLNALVGQSYNGSGVLGTSRTGNGVYADVSDSQNAIIGLQSGNGSGITGASSFAATPAPSDPPDEYAGVYGGSSTGTGVYGQSESTSMIGNGYNLQRNVGVFGYANGGPGVSGFSTSDIGVAAQNNSTFPTLYADNQAGTAANNGSSLYAYNEKTGKYTIAYSTGNFYTSGSITSGTNTVTAVSRNPTTDLMTYAAQETESTVDDVGSARLVNGSASVALAADFRQTIDGNSRYLVFITPAGASHGLYVASRSPSGFTVRENDGGRSSIDFDYRIVATPYGTHQARLPHLHDALALPPRPILGTRSPLATRSNRLSAKPYAVEAAELEKMRDAAFAVRDNRALRRGAVRPAPPGMFKIKTTP